MQTANQRAKINSRTVAERTTVDHDDMSILMPYAKIYEIKDKGLVNKDSIRAYKHSPHSVNIQIRTHQPITEWRAGVDRNMIATVGMTYEEWEVLKNHIDLLFDKSRRYDKLTVGTRYLPYGEDKQGGVIASVEDGEMSNISPRWDIITLTLDDGTKAKFYRKDIEGKEQN